MAGWTKEQFEFYYDIGAEGEWGYPGGRPEVRLHYHHGVVAPYLQARWSQLIPYFNLTSSDIVLLVGAGFGWSNEYLQEQIPGITAVGVDISDYIITEKDNTEDAEIDAKIVAVGLNPAIGRGLQIKNKYSRGSGVARSQSIIIQEDAKTNQSRNRIRQALGNTWPTWIFTEDLVNDPAMTDQDLIDLATDYGNLPSPIVHICGGYPPGSHTAQEIFNLTGQRVITVGGSSGVEEDVQA